MKYLKSLEIKGFTRVMEEYDEQLVRKMINKITVHEDRFEVEFKSGTVIDIWK